MLGLIVVIGFLVRLAAMEFTASMVLFAMDLVSVEKSILMHDDIVLMKTPCYT